MCLSPDKEKASSTQTQLTQGSLWAAICNMSWPLMLTMVAGSVVGVADIQVAAFLGSAAQAAVGLSEQVMFLFMIFAMSVSVGTTAIVSRSFGSGETADSITATSQSLLLAAVLGIVMSLMGLAIAQLILPLFTSSAEVIKQGQLYLSIFGFYLIPFSIVSIVNAAFRAIGDAKTPLVVVIVMTAITVAGDYLTVLGNWPVPGLGVKGIAFSTIAGGIAGSIIAIWQLGLSPLRQSLIGLWPPRLPILQRILNVGLPSACQRLSWAAAVFVLFFILSRCTHPTEALASWAIGMRVEGVIFMPLMALSMAVSPIVGQNLGARRLRRAVQAGWNVTAIGIVMMLILATLLFILAEPCAQLMSQDKQTISYAASYLRINALSEPFLALAMILSGALQGAGDTRMPMWISVFANWIVRLPLAWILALGLALGPTGAWIAMTGSVIIMGLLVAWRYQSGMWIKIKV
ncbi:MAG: MATE family efflux transporter [Candidatus Melainabacteria bacterium]|nr:MATE family efflux transporter [Candidatus Melainabacteria bacterium]